MRFCSTAQVALFPGTTPRIGPPPSPPGQSRQRRFRQAVGSRPSTGPIKNGQNPDPASPDRNFSGKIPPATGSSKTRFCRNLHSRKPLYFSTIRNLVPVGRSVSILQAPENDTKNPPKNVVKVGKRKGRTQPSVRFVENRGVFATVNFDKKQTPEFPKKCRFPGIFDIWSRAPPYQRLIKIALRANSCLALTAATTAHDYDIICDFTFIL